jgi:hypothetical protein
MTKKNCQEINFGSSQNHKRKSAVYKKGMPTIKCMCGIRILVVPDLKAMNRAIKNHVVEHKQADYGLVPELLEKFLTEQILTKACKLNLPHVSSETN